MTADDEWVEETLDRAGVPSYWAYGVTRQTVDSETIYAIREIYFAHPGEVVAWSKDPDGVQGDTPDDLLAALDRMREAVQLGQVLDIDTKEWL